MSLGLDALGADQEYALLLACSRARARVANGGVEIARADGSLHLQAPTVLSLDEYRAVTAAAWAAVDAGIAAAVPEITVEPA